MGGYIGATAVGLTTTAADVQGDITSTDTTPELILKNTSEEDTEGGREGKITFKGEQSGGEESTLAQIESAHDGTADDQKGDLIFKTNDGSDGASPTERMRIDSAGTTTITVTGNEDTLNLISTDADATKGPILNLYRNSASPADSDATGRINFQAENSAGETITYAQAFSSILDVTDGTEDGRYKIGTMVAGSFDSRMDMSNTETVFNDDSKSIDFRVESDSSAHGIFLDASEPSVGIGVGTADTTTARMAVGLTGAVTAGDTDGATIGKGSTLRLIDDTNWSSANSTIFLMGGGTGGAIGQISSAIGFARESASNWGTQLKFYTHPADTSDLDELDERMRINATGDILFGTTSTVLDGRISSNFAGNARRGLTLNDTTSTNTANFVAFAKAGSEIGKIQKVSGSNSVNYSTTSDHRLKENQENISDGITRIKQLRPYKFNWTDYPEEDKVDGFFAHEVQAIIPEAISGTHNQVEVWKEGQELPDGVSVGDNKLDDDGNTIPVYQSIDQSKLVPLLTAALQEAIAKIETLETQNTTQATQIADLITRVEALEGA